MIKDKLTKREIDHLLTLIRINEQNGDYYGNQLHYWKRSYKIKDKLKQLINL